MHSRGRDPQAFFHYRWCLIWQLGARGAASSPYLSIHHTRGSNPEGNLSSPKHPSPSANEEQCRVPLSAFSLQACCQSPISVVQTSMHERRPVENRENNHASLWLVWSTWWIWKFSRRRKPIFLSKLNINPESQAYFPVDRERMDRITWGIKWFLSANKSRLVLVTVKVSSFHGNPFWSALETVISNFNQVKESTNFFF